MLDRRERTRHFGRNSDKPQQSSACLSELGDRTRGGISDPLLVVRTAPGRRDERPFGVHAKHTSTACWQIRHERGSGSQCVGETGDRRGDHRRHAGGRPGLRQQGRYPCPGVSVGDLELDPEKAVDLQVNEARQQISVCERDIGGPLTGTDAADQAVSYGNKPRGGNVVGLILTGQDVLGSNQHLTGDVMGWPG